MFILITLILNEKNTTSNKSIRRKSLKKKVPEHSFFHILSMGHYIIITRTSESFQLRYFGTLEQGIGK